MCVCVCVCVGGGGEVEGALQLVQSLQMKPLVATCSFLPLGTPGHLCICDIPLLSPDWGRGGQLVQSLQMKPQVIKCSFPRELFTSNGSKNFFLIYLKYLLLKIGTSVRQKKKTNVFCLFASLFLLQIL